MTDIIVEPFDFSHLKPGLSHVMIHINVGKMPPSRVHNHLQRIRKETPLCRQLGDMGITFTVAAMHESSTDVKMIRAIEVETEISNEPSPEDLEAYEAFERANSNL